MWIIWDVMFVGWLWLEWYIECGLILVICGMLLVGDWLVFMLVDQFLIENCVGLFVVIGLCVLGLWCSIGLIMCVDWVLIEIQVVLVDILLVVVVEWEQ